VFASKTLNAELLAKCSILLFARTHAIL